MSTPETRADTESESEPLLEARGLRKHFETNTGIVERLTGKTDYVKAVDGVDITIDREETLGLVGESGCGKTTLGRVLARLYEPTEGTIEFDGKDISGLSGSSLKKLRKRVQVIFQDPQSSLNPRKTAMEIVEKPIEVHGLASGEEKEERVRELFDEVGLSETHLDRYPHKLSGGQRQRVGIARALAVEPDLIIADEPVSALDVSVQAQIINLMKNLQQKYGLSYLFIAHDLSVVKHISDRVGVMYLGRIVEKGTTQDIFGRPQHPYTRALLHSIPHVEGEQGRRETILQGAPPSPINPPDGCRFHPRCPEYMDGTCERQSPELAPVKDASGVIAPPKSIQANQSKEGSSSDHYAACHWLDKDARERAEQDPLS